MAFPLLDLWFSAPLDDHVSGRARDAHQPASITAELSAADAALVEALGNADDGIAGAALRKLHAQWAAPLARYVEQRIHSADAADDVVQELFLSVWARRTMLIASGSLRAYLFGAAHRRSSQWLRHAHVAHRWAERAASEIVAGAEGWHAREGAPDVDTEARELASVLQAAIGRLAPRQREALLLYRERELSLAEVAEIMGISVNTVKVQLQRAGAVLRQVVEQYLK